MDTPQIAFSGKPGSEKSQSSSETPPPVGPVESAPVTGQTTQSRHPNHETGGAPEGSAPSPAGADREAFLAHLTSLRWAKKITNLILRTNNPKHRKVRGTIDHTWQLLFELVRNVSKGAKSFDQAELATYNTLSSIIQRLSSSYIQINNLETKLCVDEQERFEREKQKTKMLQDLKDARTRGGLTLETIRELEQTLKLL
ncbi:MAG: hypothetical protein Q7Q73_08005 [Verrucomicrobiota bacterium JB024]|nr:hypothetical protein [Verrucomicrobiota bacterium JB024]